MNVTARALKTGLAAMVTALFLVAGCQQQAGNTDSIAGILAPVPADTPYFFGNLHFIPDADYEYQMSLFAPRLVQFLDAVQRSSELKAEGESEENRKRMRVVLQRVKSYLQDESNWQQYRAVMYGLEIFPVVRVQLHDAERTASEIQQMHDSLAVEPDLDRSLGFDIYTVALEDTGLNLYYGVESGYFTATIVPASGSQQWLPRAFAQQLPEAAVTLADVESLMQQRGYIESFAGYADLVKSFDYFLDQESAISQWLRSHASRAEGLDFDQLSAECRAEYRELVALVPRVEWGMRQNDQQAVAVSTYVRLRSDVAQGLMGLTGDLPGLDQDPGGELALAASFRVGPARDFIVQMARNVEADPFSCDNLQDLNDSAQELLAKAGTPIPPFAGQVRGLKMQLNGMTAAMSGQVPEFSSALFVDNAQLLLSMGQLFLPQLAELDLPPDGTPVDLSEVLSALPFINDGKPAFAALTDTAIGVARGDALVQDLSTLMDDSGSGGGILFSYWYDYAAMMDIYGSSIAETYADASGGYDANDAADDSGAYSDDEYALDDEMADDGDSREMSEEKRAMMIAFKEALTSWGEVLDRTGYWVKPTADGVQLEQVSTFKHP